jgi:D-alanyl-D-alanine carboxypeptidase
MSAGIDAAGAITSFHGSRPTNDASLLAPAFAAAVAAAIAECNDDTSQLAAKVYETYRSNELQALYYQRGRSVRPPSEPVTNAQNNLYSWHGYGLAVDVIHRTKEWDAGDVWFERVAEIFKKHGCKWGGDWKHRDLPHFQWGLCKASPSDRARELLRSGGVLAVWEAVGALTTAER